MAQELLRKFFQRECSSTEAYEVQKWINSRSGAEEFLNSFDAFVWQQNKEEVPTSEIRFTIHERIKIETLTEHLIRDHKEIEFKVSKAKPKTPQIRFHLFKIAAAVLLLIISAFTIYYFAEFYDQQNASDLNNEPAFITKTTEAGQRLTIHLSDGSLAVLNANSSISYPENFNDSIRLVHMTGEVFYDVAKDPGKPFIVSTSQLETTALGTSFNIRACGTVKHEVSLLTGKVRVESYSTSLVNYLEPGEEVTFDGKELKKNNFNKETKVLWKDGIINFEETPLRICFRILEDWYDVEILVDENYDMTERKMSGRFNNDYLTNVLNSISYAQNFDYEMDKKRITIKFKD